MWFSLWSGIDFSTSSEGFTGSPNSVSNGIHTRPAKTHALRKNTWSKYNMRHMTIHVTPKKKNKGYVPSFKVSASSQTAGARNRIWFPLVQGAMETRPGMFSKWPGSKQKPGFSRCRKPGLPSHCLTKCLR